MWFFERGNTKYYSPAIIQSTSREDGAHEEELADSRRNGWTDRRTRQTDGRTDGPARRMDGQTNGRPDGRTDGRTIDRTGKSMDGRIDG